MTEIEHELGTAGSAMVSDALGRWGAMASAIRRLSGTSAYGPAFPVRTMPGDSSTVHRAVAAAPEGSVLVIDAGGYEDRAVWGEILTIAAEIRGISGVVIDGAARDIDAIRARSFPVFARAVCAAGPHKGWNGTIGDQITCGGLLVRSRDLVVADGDGVVVVPEGQLSSVAEAVAQRRDLEAEWRRRLHNGELSVNILGIDNSAAEDRS